MINIYSRCYIYVSVGYMLYLNKKIGFLFCEVSWADQVIVVIVL